MDVKKKLLVINQSIEELKQTEIQIWTRISSDKTRRSTETINDHIEKIQERVSNLETRYNQHQKSLNEVTKLGLALLDKVSSLKDVIGMLVCYDEDIRNTFSERQTTKLEENHSHFHSETDNVKSEISHVSNSTSNVPETQDTNEGGNELQILVEDNVLDKSACSHIEDVAVNKTEAEATIVVTKNNTNSSKNERNYVGNDKIKNRVLLETDLNMSSWKKNTKNSGSNEKYINMQEDNVTENDSADIEQKTNNHIKICRNEFGYKFKLSNMELDNRVSFHNKLAAFGEGLAVSSSEDITLPPPTPNIKLKIPTEIITKRSDKSDTRLYSLFSKLEDDSVIETDAKGQPKTSTDWLKFADQVNVHTICRVRSNPPRRGSGQHAILVLDTSEYMKGYMFESMKSAAIQYVEGIQQINTTTGMEDNIGLAIFGGQTCIIQESTSNYDLVKRLIAQLKPEGSAPVLAGLLMGLVGVLAGPLGRVNGCTIQGRIIVFTNGTSGTKLLKSKTEGHSPESFFIGDFRGYATETEVIGILTDRCIRTYYVPIGNHKHNTDMKLSSGNIMEQAVRQTNGKIVPHDEMYRLIRMSQVVLLAVKLASELRYSSEGKDRELIRRKIHQNASLVDTHDDCLDIGIDFINPLSANNRKGKYAELNCRTLQLGDRVRRGPDWRFDDQDSNLPGTVVGQQRDGWVLVEWDSGTRNIYPHDEQADHYGLRKVNERRILVDEMVAVGCRVHRGRDWKYNDDDGGQGSLGTVLKVRQEGTIIVRWDCKTIGLYKIGFDGIFEITVCEDSSKYLNKIKQKPEANSHTINDTDLTDEESNEENKVQTNNGDFDYVIPIYSESAVSALWEFKIDDSGWRQYPPNINEKIEKAFKRKSGKVIIEMDQSTYVVNFTKMVQEHPQNKTKIPVRRKD